MGWPFCFFSPDGLRPETKQMLNSTSKKKGKGGGKGGPASEEEPKADSQPVSIHLHFKRYVFDPHKKMVQSWSLLHTLQPETVTVLDTWREQPQRSCRGEGNINLCIRGMTTFILFFGGQRQSVEMQGLCNVTRMWCKDCCIFLYGDGLQFNLLHHKGGICSSTLDAFDLS